MIVEGNDEYEDEEQQLSAFILSLSFARQSSTTSFEGE